MKFLLDTNICIHYINGEKKLQQKLLDEAKNISISRITDVELRFGAYCSQRTEYHLSKIMLFENDISLLEITPNIFEIYIQKRFELRKNGFKVPDFDLLIAATALHHNLILVTENIKDFQNIEGLKIENWITKN